MIWSPPTAGADPRWAWQAQQAARQLHDASASASVIRACARTAQTFGWKVCDPGSARSRDRRRFRVQTTAEITSSPQPVLLLRVRGEGDAVAWPVRDAEGAALAPRHPLEEIRGGPVDPLDEEGIGQGGRHV